MEEFERLHRDDSHDFDDRIELDDPHCFEIDDESDSFGDADSFYRQIEEY